MKISLTTQEQRDLITIFIHYGEIETFQQRKRFWEESEIKDYDFQLQYKVDIEGPTETFAYSVIDLLKSQPMVEATTKIPLLYLLQYLRNKVRGLEQALTIINTLIIKFENPLQYSEPQKSAPAPDKHTVFSFVSTRNGKGINPIIYKLIEKEARYRVFKANRKIIIVCLVMGYFLNIVPLLALTGNPIVVLIVSLVGVLSLIARRDLVIRVLDTVFAFAIKSEIHNIMKERSRT